MELTDILRTSLHLAGILGVVEEHADHVVVRTPHNPGYYNGNYLLLPTAPLVLAPWIQRYEEVFGKDVGFCIIKWIGGDATRDVLDDAFAVGFESDGGVALGMDAPPPLRDSTWSVRKLDLKRDWDAMVSLNVVANGSEPSGSSEYKLFRERARATWRAWIEPGHATWWGAFDGATLVGQCGLLDCGGLGRFQSVETHPQWRRRGVCSTLLATVARDAFERLECRRVLLEAEGHGPALGVYRRLGFIETDRTRALLRANEPMSVRAELPGDHAGVRSLVTAAFGQPGEADLVEQLRGNPGVISLVAASSGRLQGHVMFTPVTVDPDGASWSAIALAPMAVRPGDQRRGVGSALARAGLDACREAGHDVCFVLGHPAYYPRFGFRPAPPLGLTCAWPVPDDVFMVAELRPGALLGRTGRVAYDPVFDTV